MLLLDLHKDGGSNEDRAAQAWVRLRPSARITARVIRTAFIFILMLVLTLADIIVPFCNRPALLRQKPESGKAQSALF